MQDDTKHSENSRTVEESDTSPDQGGRGSRIPFPVDRRHFLAGASALGLSAMGSARVGENGDDGAEGTETATEEDDDGDGDETSSRFAVKEHDHSGEYGAAASLGEQAPVESITTDELYTRNAPVINVQAYGAAGDGESDDHEAIQRAFDAADHRSVVYFPPGHYLSSDAITASDKSLTIRGDGMGVTRVEFTGGTDGFDLSLPSTNESGIGEESYVTVRDLSLGTSVSGSGTAISAVWDAPPSGAIPHLVVENVNIRDRGNAGEDEGHFLTGIHADNAWRARVNNFHYSGFVHDIPLGDEDDIDEFEPEMIGIEFVGRCVDSSITACHFSRCDVGIMVGREGRRNTEGVRIDEVTMVDTYKGIVAKSGPWLTVTSSHFNGRRTAVELDSRWEAQVSNCLFYRVPWSRTDEWAGVHAKDTWNIHVSNVNIGDLSSNVTVGRAAHLESCSECVVSGNVMNGLAYEGSSTVEATESSRIMVSENVARDARHAVTFTDSVNNSLAHGNWGTVRNAGRLNLVRNNLSPFTVSQADRNNVPGDALDGPVGLGGVGDTYGQTFTVEQPFEIVELHVANFTNPDSAATVTLFKGDPLSDESLEKIDSERVEGWPNMEWLSFDFVGDEPGTYYLELSDPEETPTWWWWELPLGGEESLDDVGGEALVDRQPVTEVDFPVTDDTLRDSDVEAANFQFTVLGVEQ